MHPNLNSTTSEGHSPYITPGYGKYSVAIAYDSVTQGYAMFYFSGFLIEEGKKQTTRDGKCPWSQA